MNWIGILLLLIHIISCTGLILIVLLQAGKGASLGAAFGGGASQTVFGARSATLIGRTTWVLAAAFMLTSLLLTKFSPWQEFGLEGAPSSILQQEPAVMPPDQSSEQPVAPAPAGEPLSSELPATGTIPAKPADMPGEREPSAPLDTFAEPD